MARQTILIVHNVRSCHNVGSLLRTAEGLGVKKVYLTGYTPYPITDNDDRLPHTAAKVQRQIDKTALGADQSLAWEQVADIFAVIDSLQKQAFTVTALEQTPAALDIRHWTPPAKVAVIIGRETDGIEPEVLAQCKVTVEVPMLGKKESFNVVQAAAMALFYCTFF